MVDSQTPIRNALGALDQFSAYYVSFNQRKIFSALALTVPLTRRTLDLGLFLKAAEWGLCSVLFAPIVYLTDALKAHLTFIFVKSNSFTLRKWSIFE